MTLIFSAAPATDGTAHDAARFSASSPTPAPAAPHVEAAAAFAACVDPAAPGPAPDNPEDKPDPGSLLAARVAGARALLGDAAGEDDDVLLVAANDIHQKAVKNPDDADAQAASQSLWRAEARAWASANGASPAIDEEARVQAYLDLWSLALNPPAPPIFLTRRDVATKYVLERASKGQSIAIASKPSASPVSTDALVDHHMESADVRRRYYGQFADYVDTHLEHFSTLGAIGDAVAAGIPRLRLEERPRRMWHIENVSAFPSGAHKLPSGSTLSLLGRSLGESYVAEMENGDFLHIDAGGKTTLLPPALAREDGRLKIALLLDALGLTSSPSEGSGASAASSTGRAATEYAVAHQAYEPVPLRGHIVELRRKAAHAAIMQWKADNYLPSRLETVARLFIPFYTVYHNMKWDPGYRLQASDVAVDAAALAITVAGIAFTAGGGSAGIVAAQASVRAAAAHGVKAMVAAGMRAVLAKFHVRTLLLASARELADFVVPVFSAGRLLKSAAQVSPLAAQALKNATRKAGAALRQADARRLANGLSNVAASTTTVQRNATTVAVRLTLDHEPRKPMPACVQAPTTLANLADAASARPS